ncbi:MAG TPA: hypothetical protein VF530_23115 [Planctomycetota bacterium]
MKTPEILLASALIALVGGAGAALATRAFFAADQRLPVAQREPLRAAEGTLDEGGASSEVAALRRGQTELLQRLAALEQRLAELASTRTAAAPSALQPATQPGDGPTAAVARELAGEAPELTPDFVASVEAALGRIQKAEEAEREKTRKELAAQRIEERVTRLQQELGLTNRQASDVRTALLTQDEKRETLFAGMRDGTTDPAQVRDTFRTLRDDTHAELQRVLTADQYAAFVRSEEREFGRRGDFGGPGGPPDGGGFGRPR